jgi:hypothetical protein
MSYLSNKLLELLALSSCKSHTQILESVIFLPILVELMDGSIAFDWTVRKMAIDVIYTFAAILKESISPYKADLL